MSTSFNPSHLCLLVTRIRKLSKEFVQLLFIIVQPADVCLCRVKAAEAAAE